MNCAVLTTVTVSIKYFFFKTYFTNPMGFWVVSRIFFIWAIDWLFAGNRIAVKRKRQISFFTLKI
jgi:hypothetical protein